MQKVIIEQTIEKRFFITHFHMLIKILRDCTQMTNILKSFKVTDYSSCIFTYLLSITFLPGFVKHNLGIHA